MDEWIKKRVCVCARTVCVVSNRVPFSLTQNESLLFATTRMDLKGIRLSEITQRKTNTAYISLVCRI